MHYFSVFVSRHAYIGKSKHGDDRDVMTSHPQLPWNADGGASFLVALFSAPRSLFTAFLLSERTRSPSSHISRNWPRDRRNKNLFVPNVVECTGYDALGIISYRMA